MAGHLASPFNTEWTNEWVVYPENEPPDGETDTVLDVLSQQRDVVTDQHCINNLLLRTARYA